VAGAVEAAEVTAKPGDVPAGRPGPIGQTGPDEHAEAADELAIAGSEQAAP
jgi:hypothetical protein